MRSLRGQELLECRALLAGDVVGDTTFTATDTLVGPAASYSLVSEIGDVTPPNVAGHDVDMFRIHGFGQVGRQLTITTSLPAGESEDDGVDAYLRLFDEFGAELAADDDSGGGGYSQIVYLITSINDLYVGVSGKLNTGYNAPFGGGTSGNDVGKYRIDVSIEETDIGDTIASAVDTGVSSLQDAYSTIQYMGDGAFLAKDVDMYEVNVAAGEVLTITTSLPSGSTNPVNTYLRLFNSAGAQVAFDDDGGVGQYSEIVFPVIEAGTYYVGVSGSPNTSYMSNLAGSGLADGVTGEYQIDISVPYDSDLIIHSAKAVAGGSLELTYEVVGGTVAPFDIGIYQSASTVLDGDTLLSRPSVTLESDRTVGMHTVSFAIGGAVLLPGAGADETDADYHLIAVLDDLDNLLEIDADPLNEDNTAVITGAYLGGSTLFIHGGLGADTIVVAPDLTFSVTGNNYDFDGGAVSEIRVRSHAGNDVVSGAGVAETMRIWGGADNDTLTGGALADIIDGGDGADTLRVTAVTNLTLTDTQVVGAGTDTFTNIEAAHLIGTAGNNKLDARAFTLGPVTLEGLAGNDTLIGGERSDLLIGGAGNDKYLFFAANADQTDTIVEANGGGTDLLDFSSFGVSLPVNVDLSNPVAIAVHGSAGSMRTIITTNGLQNNLEKVNGGAGNDVIVGNTANNTFLGNAGNDTLSGGDGNDKLTGGAGSDVLDGGAGNDTYIFEAAAGAEADSVADISGKDTLHFAKLSAATPLTVDLSANGVIASHSGRTVSGNGPDFENVTGGAGDDNMTGNALNNSFTGGNGNDVLTGGDGNDTLNGGAGDDTLTGNDGNDRLTGGAGNDDLDGGAGNDTYTFAAAVGVEVDDVFETTGADTLNFNALSAGAHLTVNLTQAGAFATHAGRTVNGDGLAFENVTGGAGNDHITGNDSKNALTGNAGNDTLIGNGDNDTLKGGAGNDILDGGDGNDTYTFAVAEGTESDSVIDSSGVDSLVFNALASTTPLSVDLTVNGTFATHEGRTVNGNGLDFENVNGGEGDDTLTGNNSNNKLDGRGGDDTLNGLGGNDNLIGGAGIDVFYIDGTDGADDLDLLFASGKIRAQRREIGAKPVLEQDTLNFEAVDFIHLRALAGDDTIDVANAITADGQVDGGDDTDTCGPLPAGWTAINCEL